MNADTPFFPIVTPLSHDHKTTTTPSQRHHNAIATPSQCPHALCLTQAGDPVPNIRFTLAQILGAMKSHFSSELMDEEVPCSCIFMLDHAHFILFLLFFMPHARALTYFSTFFPSQTHRLILN
jgi:hypothetical protein